MPHFENSSLLPHQPWNKGRLTGSKPPLQPKHVWAIRTRLLILGRVRDLALFNLAIDSKLRGCDVVSLSIEDVAPRGYAVDRATVRQRKARRPVKFEINEQTRQAIDDHLVALPHSPSGATYTAIGLLKLSTEARALVRCQIMSAGAGHQPTRRDRCGRSLTRPRLPRDFALCWWRGSRPVEQRQASCSMADDPHRLLYGVTSTGRCNTGVKTFCWGFEAQRLARSLI